jgi:hypothetical protein
MDVVDADDDVIGAAPAPTAVVTDNGPCFGGVTFADAFAGDDPLFRHVRTRVRSPPGLDEPTHARLPSPSNPAMSVWPLADPLPDWEVLT